jgi:hypothetical protein
VIDEIVRWFMHEPLKNGLLIFGSGGILAACFKWGSMWADRRRIRVRMLSEHFNPKASPTIEVSLTFEVTNLGEKSTSLEPEVTVQSMTPERKVLSFVLPIQETDRQLLPHTPKTFTAKAIVPAVYVFCWFRRYSFRVLRGSSAIVRHRNAKHEEISFARYWCEYLLFRWLGQVVNAA